MIDAYCVDEITVLKWEGNDSWGEPESGTEYDFKSRVDWRTRLIRDIRGEERVSEVMVMMPKKIDRILGRALRHEDRIQIGGESFDRAILLIMTPKDFSKPHYEIYLA